MRLGFLAIDNPLDRSSWSGLPYYALRELRRRFAHVEVIDTPRADWLLQRAAHLRRFGLSPTREPLVAEYFAQTLRPRIDALKPDAIVAINAVHKIVGLNGRYPTVYCSDGFFANIVDYYPQFSQLSPRARRNGDNQQRALLATRASLCLSSEWAVRTAATYYGQSQDRFRVVPFGANFDLDPASGALRPNSGPLKLLFVGYDWARKGGDLVLEVFKGLRERFGDAELHIAGCSPPQAQGVEGVIVHGRLDKSDPEQAARLEALFRDSSFFIMPSRQEAYGLAYCEACAFGLPPIGADTGGVGTIVRDGENGLLLPLDADPGDYVRAIGTMWSDAAAYRDLQIGARESFEARLNWRAWGDQIEQELLRLIGATPGARLSELAQRRLDREAQLAPVVDAGVKVGLGGR